ncbi:MAG: pantoate--beta-alanine ligase [Phycisphaerales bacterium]
MQLPILATSDHLADWAGCVLVPTMGALHAGHAELIRLAAKHDSAVPIVVSIFVNPTQFGPGEDFERYPRTLDADLELVSNAGAAAVFVPDVATMYPDGYGERDDASNAVVLPPVATQPRLEDAQRPGHFRGVAQVVARLFDLVQPRAAVFGEKDFQQLRMIEEMVAEARERWGSGAGGLDIVRCPIVRDDDGLAMSSRNRFLSESSRAAALGISRALLAAVELATPGRNAGRIEERMRATLIRHHLEVDYAVVRAADTLLQIDAIEEHVPARALIAARIDGVRLIDNVAVGV